ncbi:phosphotransferase [Paenibacillus sp. TRM 82003]|uniref:phosphotransferase n=1 Tax=Kineococcus sp. TRM81007 TaxID=2925831 RepID=UPI001F573A25|nr:phosphotransferase [Kineococcus sp. TRM81007]MCI2238362.1 phosphotransferase [Kineococcus sp. TRM81007]MCI3922124.1 phosphotransferase [Paenibacillus sp. TRM 82003]
MLPLHEIDRLAVTVDEEWRSPAADAVAAAWGCEPGRARWWRSSASHVFVLPDPDGGGRSYLRFTPAAHASRQRVGAVAELVEQLGREGARVAAPVPSTTGTLVETVATPLGQVHATCVRAAPGEQFDVDELTPAQARAWGASLASLHAATDELGSTLVARLPTAGSVLEDAQASLAEDAPLQHEPLVRLRPELQRQADEHRAHLLDAPAVV